MDGLLVSIARSQDPLLINIINRTKETKNTLLMFRVSGYLHKKNRLIRTNYLMMWSFSKDINQQELMIYFLNEQDWQK